MGSEVVSVAGRDAASRISTSGHIQAGFREGAPFASSAPILSHFAVQATSLATQEGVKPLSTQSISQRTQRESGYTVCETALEGLLVGGGAVERGHGDIQQAQVHGELSAVVDDVVEDHAAQDGASGFAE